MGKSFEGEIFIRSLPTTLLQILSYIILNFKVLIKSIKDPDDNSSNSSINELNGGQGDTKSCSSGTLRNGYSLFDPVMKVQRYNV